MTRKTSGRGSTHPHRTEKPPEKHKKRHLANKPHAAVTPGDEGLIPNAISSCRDNALRDQRQPGAAQSGAVTDAEYLAARWPNTSSDAIAAAVRLLRGE
jgi:hypothetical protein